MSRQTFSTMLFALCLLLGVLAAATLLPASNHVLSDLGYHTFCPFAPWSTLALMALAGLGWIVRNYIDAQPS